MPLLKSLAYDEGSLSLVMRLEELEVGNSFCAEIESVIVKFDHCCLQTPLRTAESMLERDACQLSKESGIQLQTIEAFRLRVAQLNAPRKRARSAPGCDELQEACPTNRSNTAVDIHPFDSADELLEAESAVVVKLTSGSVALDELLGGGISTNEVTEIVGRSGSGKTQMCFTLAVEAVHAGYSVLFLDTTNSYSTSRLMEISKTRLGLRNYSCASSAFSTIGTRVRVERVFDIFSALAFVENLCCSLLRREEPSRTPTLLILDSVTALIAPVLGGEGRSFGGQALISHLAASLHRLANQCHVGVIVTNEARSSASDFSAADEVDGGGSLKNFAAVKPALGQSWMYTASVRIALNAAPSNILQTMPHHSLSSTRCSHASVVKHPRMVSTSFAAKDILEHSVDICIGVSGVI
jgi:RecA/RadA recombinase